MIKSRSTIGFLFCIVLSFKANAQVSTPPAGGSQKSKVCQWMGVTEVCVTYGSPDVISPSGKDRHGQIWGKLVPYGMGQESWLEKDGEMPTLKPWRAGANENTVLTISHDVMIEGKPLRAGAYGVFFVAGEKEWELILSNDSKNWGHYTYNEKNDALRVKVIPEKSEYHQWLTYEFTEKKLDKTTLTLFWDDLKVSVRISVNSHQTYNNQIKEELQTRKILYWYNWYEAAKYCLDNNTDLEQGLDWIDRAIDQPWIGNANFATYKTKSDLLYALNRKHEADSLIQFAIRNVGGVFDLHNYGRELLEKNKSDEAFSVLMFNASQHPGFWVTQLGLARAYGAKEDFKNALKYAQAARKLIPKKETGLRHYAIDVLIGQLEKKQKPPVYFAKGLEQAY
jgi:tetratricopeptide (TPR) repeat protein